MKVSISYHIWQKGEGDKIVDLITLNTQFLHTRNISIDSISSSQSHNHVHLYVSPPPTRIDQQGDTVILLDHDFAEKHPKPYGIHDNHSTFGQPQTIWPREDKDANNSP